MDTNAQAQQMLADLAENGGGTYTQRDLSPFRPIAGFAVGIGGAILPAGDVTADNVAFVARAVAGEYMTDYVGTWLSDGKVYLDAVRYFSADRKADACLLAIAAGQEAIYDFASGEAIDMPKEASL